MEQKDAIHAQEYIYKITPQKHPMFGRKGLLAPQSKKIGSMYMNGKYLMIKLRSLRWEFYHVYKVEKYIGRKLKEKEIVHHIDGNPLNNKLSNLYIFSKRGIHSSFETLIHCKIISPFIIKSNLNQFKRKK